MAAEWPVPTTPDEPAEARTIRTPILAEDINGGAATSKGSVDGGGGCPTGLDRSGKSCRLRWVNYLHPGLKHGRLSPQEELLVLQLHDKWGNRWSRIAACLPGRTDNEIKNYWRTHKRKEAQERTALTVSSSSASSTSSASSSSHGSTSGSAELSKQDHETDNMAAEAYSMDEIWAEIAAAEAESFSEDYREDCCSKSFPWRQIDHDTEFKITHGR